MKINLPKDTAISFRGDSNVYHVDYQQLLYCNDSCDMDHDCYEEPYIACYQIIRTAKPVSQLRYIFDSITGIGRKFDPQTEIVSSNS